MRLFLGGGSWIQCNLIFISFTVKTVNDVDSVFYSCVNSCS